MEHKNEVIPFSPCNRTPRGSLAWRCQQTAEQKPMSSLQAVHGVCSPSGRDDVREKHLCLPAHCFSRVFHPQLCTVRLVPLKQIIALEMISLEDRPLFFVSLCWFLAWQYCYFLKKDMCSLCSYFLPPMSYRIVPLKWNYELLSNNSTHSTLFTHKHPKIGTTLLWQLNTVHATVMGGVAFHRNYLYIN